MNQYKIGQRVRITNIDSNGMQVFTSDERRGLKELIVRVVAYIGEFNNIHFWQLETPVGYRNFADSQFRALKSKTAKMKQAVLPVFDLIYEMKWLDKIKKNFNVGEYLGDFPSPHRYGSIIRAMDNVPVRPNGFAISFDEDEREPEEIENDVEDDLFA